MTEEEARNWVREQFGVSRETQLSHFADILVAGASEQNLIAASTLGELWARHLVDSAQLIPLAVEAKGLWLDIGSGAGLPGLVVAVLTDRPVMLVEPRARRVEFLRAAADQLGLADRVEVIGSKVESCRPKQPAAVISARAVAELGKLFAGAQHCTDSSTVWVLPKGRNAQSEVEAARRTWQGAFHVEPSITSPDSGIVVAKRVRPR
ncbi:16S rRNA (guanine(527)-N(7))-methyltransferase RsmG [Sphingomonas sp. AOB5]|uniref:16S rRNA (guanine(527)-N(7))-methyltransferase RsmG n=1 Tax=Sphingomonas sp. AOB5 TaxID=3034017 RepID=UPI0023F91631|nr:16S rRNA (guanine(527)-N(7))-methyltransferase RsmG [Sphingomonas sp. AOB5]MDF7774170.1 16S rRNA (guanine(527)-N(7))-methyltransferase RsmG [Sphingomonas sp. AOB5]